MIIRSCFFLLLLFTGSAYAVQPSEMLSDPALEVRARQISEGLRCLVCQNQSIDDSDADLAHDLRLVVRQRLQAGDSDNQVRQFLVDRYGDYILLSPPFKVATAILWVGPIAFLVAGFFATMLFYKRRALVEAQPLSAEEKKRLEALMNSQDKEKGKA